MSRQNLTATKGGINRLRVKGSPSPDTLFDGLNCYVDQDGSPQSRPGSTIEYVLPSDDCKGLMAYKNALVTFAHQVQTGMPAGISAVVLSNPNDATQPLRDIHFSAAFMGFPYVAAEFLNAQTFHYWLEEALAWQPDTIYMIGDLVSPTTPNGIAYRANRLSTPNPAWAPNVARTVGDIVEPTEYNGYQYEVIDTIGANPRSGSTEPTWPAQTGATVTEDTDGAGDVEPTPSTTPDGNTTLPPEVEERYKNPAGNLPAREA